MYFYIPEVSDRRPSYISEYAKFWKKYGISPINAQIKYSDSDKELFEEEFFESANSVDVSIIYDDHKIINISDSELNSDFNKTIRKIYTENPTLPNEVNEYWKKHAAELLFVISKRNKIDNQSIKKEVQKSLSEFNDNALRFINELIQNADDCIYKDDINRLTMRFDQEHSEITISYPEEGFTYDDIIALSSINETNKMTSFDKATTTIGEKGRGFKSIFVYFKEVEIESGGYHFKYNVDEASMFQPIYMGTPATNDGTKLILRLKDEIILTSEEDTKRKINADMSELIKDVKDCYGATDPRNLYRNNSIFFTRNFTELVMIFSDKRTSEIIKIVNTHHIEDSSEERKLWWENPDNKKLHYCTGSMEYYSVENIANKDVDRTINTLSLNYKIHLIGIVKYLNYDQGIISSRYGKVDSIQTTSIKKTMPIIIFGVGDIEANKDIEKIDVSEFSGHMYTYLPTSLNISLPFIFQMPFDLEDNRSCPKNDNEWNYFLLDKVWNPDDSIIRDWYEYSADHNLVTSIYNYLPTRKNSIAYNYKTLAFYIDDKYNFDSHGGSKYASYAKAQIEKFNKENAEKARRLFANIAIFENSDTDEFINITELLVLDRTLSLFDTEDGNIYWKHYRNQNSEMHRFIFNEDDESSQKVIAFQKYINHTSILLQWKNVMGNDKVHESIELDFKEKGKNGDFKEFERFSNVFLSTRTWLTALGLNKITDIKKDDIEHINEYGDRLLYFKVSFIDGDIRWVNYQLTNNANPTMWVTTEKELLSHKIQKELSKKKSIIRVCALNLSDNKYNNSIIRTLINSSVKSYDELISCIEKWEDKRLSPEEKLQIAGGYYLFNYNEDTDGVNSSMSALFNAVSDINDEDVVCCPQLYRDDEDKNFIWEQIRFLSWYGADRKNNYELNIDYISEKIAEKINPSSETVITSQDKHITFSSAIEGRYLSDEEKDIGLKKFEKTYHNCVVNPEYFRNLPNRNFLKFRTTGYLLLRSEEYLSDACDSETMLTTQFIQSVRERYSRVEANKYETGSMGRNVGTIKAIQAYQIFSLIDNNNYREVIGKEGDVCNELLQNINDFINPGTSVSIEIEQGANGESWMTLIYEEKAHLEVVKGKNEEKHGFLPSDILSLISIGNSTKNKEGEKYTGNKGIGFKNIYKIFDQVCVDSNGYRFFLDDSYSLDPEVLFEELNDQGVGNIYSDKSCKVETIMQTIGDSWDVIDEKGRRKRFPIIQVYKDDVDKSLYYRDNRSIGDGRKAADTLTAYKFRFRSNDMNRLLQAQLKGHYLQWLFPKNKELAEGFSLTDFNANNYNMVLLFLHNLSKIILYEDGKAIEEYLTYPICDEDESLDLRWIESDKFYSNRGLMSGLNLIEVKSDRYENRKNTESDGMFAYVEVRFIKSPILATINNEKVTTKDGRLYISLPTEIDTGGAVHINIPALEARANRREIFSCNMDRTNEGEWNQKIIEKAFGKGGVFKDLFNSFTEKYINEVANYAFLYVPLNIFDRFAAAFPLFESCIKELKYIPCITSNGLKMRSLGYIEEKSNVFKLDACMRSWFELMDPTFEIFYQENNKDIEFVDIIDENEWGLLEELNKRYKLKPRIALYDNRDFFEYIAKYWMSYYSKLDASYKKKCDKSFSNRISLITGKTGIKDHYTKWQQWKKVYKQSMAGQSESVFIINMIKAICFDCDDFSSAFYFVAGDINRILENDKLEIPKKVVNYYKKYLIDKGYFDFMDYYELLKTEIISVDTAEESTAIQISELFALSTYTGESSINGLVPIYVEAKDILKCVYDDLGVKSLDNLRSEIPILLMNNTFQEADVQDFFFELKPEMFEYNSLMLKQDSEYDRLTTSWIDKGFVVSRANIAQADNIYELDQLDSELYELLPTLEDSRLYLTLLKNSNICNEDILNNTLQYWKEKIDDGSNKADYFELYIESLNAFASDDNRITIYEPEIEYDIDFFRNKKVVALCNKLSCCRSGLIFKLILDEDKYESNPTMFWNEIEMSLTSKVRSEIASFYYDVEDDEGVNRGIELFLGHLYMCSDNVSLVAHYPSSQYLRVCIDRINSFVLFKDYTESIILLLREEFGYSLESRKFKPFVNLYEYNSLLPLGTQEEYESVRDYVFDVLDSSEDESEISNLKMQLMSLQYQLPDNRLIRGYGMQCPFISSNNVIEQSSLQTFGYPVFGFHIAITLYGSKEAKDVVQKYASNMVVRIAKRKTKKKKEKKGEDFSVSNGKYSFDGRELILRGSDIEKEKLLVSSILDYLIGCLNDISNNLIFEFEMNSDKGAKKKEVLKLELTHCHRAIMVYELTRAKDDLLKNA